VISIHRDGRIDMHAIPGQQIANARWMYAQCQDHGRRLRAVVGNGVARTNLHRKPHSNVQFRNAARLLPCISRAKSRLNSHIESCAPQRCLQLRPPSSASSTPRKMEMNQGDPGDQHQARVIAWPGGRIPQRLVRRILLPMSAMGHNRKCSYRA